MKNTNIINSKSFLNNAIKEINKRQEETIKKADKIIGDVETFEKNVLKDFKNLMNEYKKTNK